jgi:hypothetical protein
MLYLISSTGCLTPVNENLGSVYETIIDYEKEGDFYNDSIVIQSVNQESVSSSDIAPLHDSTTVMCSPYYSITMDSMGEFGNEYTYTIYDRQHEIVWRETEIRSGGTVEFSLIDNRIVEYHLSLSTGIDTFFYYDLEQNVMSEYFDSVKEIRGTKVVYITMDNHIPKLIIQDLFNESLYRKEIIRDFSPIANPNDIITNAEFFVVYLLAFSYISGEDYIEVTEIINLSDYTLIFHGSVNGSNYSNTAYNNPIDAFYLPLIKEPYCEVARKDSQDIYGCVWKSEFENIVKWAGSKYVYQQDKDALSDYVESVERFITVAQSLMIAELREEFDIPPGAPEFAPWGNGTQSWLNQLEGEIYRDAGMRIIENFGFRDEYIFLSIDYLKEYYK